MGRGVQRFTNLRAWQACYAYKNAVYRLCREPPLSEDATLRTQLEKSVAGPPAHIAEGFGRFNPLDFARYTVIARASLMESQNHLRDAVDKNHIAETTREELDALAVVALQEVTGLMEYLQSSEALQNARRARERRIAARHKRRNQLSPTETTTDGTNHEQGTQNSEPQNSELQNSELRTEPEHEPRTKNPEE